MPIICTPISMTTVHDGEDGNNGVDGYNTCVVPLYRRSTTPLTNSDRPNGTLTYSFTTNKLTGTGFNGWSQDIPATTSGTKLYVTMATARSKDFYDEIAANEWATPVEYVADGMNSATVIIYKRSSTQPDNNDRPANGVVYTFADASLSGTLNGWSKTIPATDGNPLWVRQATAVSSSATDTIDSSEWSGDSNGKAVKMTEDGINSAVVPLYRRSATALTNSDRPTGKLTYTFSTGALSGTASYFNSWSQSIPATTPGTKLYVTMATARSTTDTDEIAANEWATPVEYVADGMNSAPVVIYKRADSIASNDTPADGCEYTFSTGALSGTLNGWSTAIPNDNGKPCWVRHATAVSTSTKDVINASEWSAAQKHVESGTSPYFADLDNEMDSVACDSDGHVTSEQYIESNVSFFCGNVKQTIKSSGGVACNIGGYPLSDSYAAEGSPTPATTYRAVVTGLGTTSAKVKIYIKSGTSITSTNITIEVKATIGGSDQTCVVTMTMNGIRPGAAGEKAVTYNLLPSVSEINVGRTDSGGYNPSTFRLTCGYKKSVGGTITSVDDATTRIDSKYYIYYRRRYRSSQSWETSYYRYDYYRNDASHSLLALDVTTYDKVEFIICTCAYTSFLVTNLGNYTLIDKETVPVVADGAKGESITGKTGKLCYIAGIYDPSIQYTCNDDQTVAVEVETSSSVSEIWVLTATPPSAGYAPSDSSPYWSKGLNSYNLVRAKYLFSDFAKLGSGVVSGDWLYSANGKIDGTAYNNGANYGSTGKPGYMFFDPDTPMGYRNLGISATEFTNTSYTTKGSGFSLSGGNRIIKVTGTVTGGTMYVTVYKGGSATEVEVSFVGAGSEYIVLTNVSAGTNFYVKARVSTSAAKGTISSCEVISFAPNYAVDLLTGRSYQTDCFINGFIRKKKTTITTSNISQYKRDDIASATVLDFDKCGSFIELSTGTYGYLTLPLMSAYLASRYTSKQIDDIRSFVGTTMLIYNKSGRDIPMTLKYNSDGSMTSGTLRDGNCVELECCLKADDNDGKEIIYWKVIDYAEPVN